MKSTARLKKQLDSLFSKYIRQIHPARCYTCGKPAPRTKLQCGHFVSRQYLATRWDEDNCRPQCLTAKSNLRLFNGLHKSISEINVGDLLWGFDENTFSIMKSEVIGIESFLPKELYEVTLEDGRTFFATGDHRVVANGTWRRIDDMLQDVTAFDIMEL